MELNPIGLVAAASAFLGVWFGHVAVRKIEFISPTLWLPAILFAVTGIVLEWLSLITFRFSLSIAFGILGITLLWDAFEFARQQNRIKKGHAPANPNNPRHVRLMGAHATITTVELLKRDPLGKPVSPSEAIQLVTEHQLPITSHP